MSGKKISKERQVLYREMISLLKEQESRGEEKNPTQASRIMKKKHKWSENERANFIRAFQKAGGKQIIL